MRGSQGSIAATATSGTGVAEATAAGAVALVWCAEMQIGQFLLELAELSAWKWAASTLIETEVSTRQTKASSLKLKLRRALG